jgi:hypothetical protein
MIPSGHRVTFSPGAGNKKYTATIQKTDPAGRPVGRPRSVAFGDRRYGQYRDQTPLRLFAGLDHLDPSRRADYRRRHRGILTKDGRAAYAVPLTPAWFSWHYLW